MNKKQKTFLFFSLILSMFLFCSCFNSDLKLTPEETVKYFFESFKNKDINGMNKFLYDKNKNIKWDLENLNYVKLLECKEGTTEEVSKDTLIKTILTDVKEKTFVYVKFDINFKSNLPSSGFSNTIYGWRFYLIKYKDNSDWLIYDWGS